MDLTQIGDNATALNEVHILERIREFNSSLDRLMRLYTGGHVKSCEFARIVTREAGERLGVARVSAWTLSEDKTTIECIDLYLSATDEHLSGATLAQKDFPRYFKAVIEERVIAANDARTDPRTSEFTEPYLKPNRIFAMLDAQIRSAAGPRGVVCIETVDDYRDWSPDEMAYAASVAELLGFFMDRKDRREIHSKLNEINERYDLAMNAAVDGVWDLDLLTDRVFFSNQNFTLLGETHDMPPDQFSWWQKRVHPDDIDGVLAAFHEHLRDDTPYHETYRMRHTDGSWRWWRSRGQVLRDETRRAIRVVGTNSDVTSLIDMQTELKQRNEQLISANRKVEASALHDSLTGLPNRRHLDRVCEEFSEGNKGSRRYLSILLIDLDRFKGINDKWGHAVGDAMLVRAAKYLNTLKTDCEFVARIGGDEFIAILEDAPNFARAAQFCADLNERLAAPASVNGVPVVTSASIGVSSCWSNEINIWRALGDADLALYDAKKSGRNTSRVFDIKMRQTTEYNRDMKNELGAALAEGGQIVPYFQAQFDATTLDLVGFEVLARWDHPERGLLLPGDFLPFAEELNCVADLDRQIMSDAIDCIHDWRDAGLITPRLSINVSSQRLVDPNLIKCVEAMGKDVEIISFELLETTFLDFTNDQVSQAFDSLRKLGVDFEIDDFGTGYASILGLVNVRPRRLKIDRSLTRNVHTDRARHSLVKSIIDIARALKVEVVAEGVEIPEQITALADLGCDVLQGFYLAVPISSDDVIARFADKAPQAVRNGTGETA